jgi:hypothetical protein
VVEASARATLVRRGFDGALERIDEEPDVAALRLAGLTAEQQAALEERVAARHGEFDALLRDLYATRPEDLGALPMLRESLGSRERRAEAAGVITRIRGHFEPILSRGSLIDELQSVLTPVQQAEAKRLVEEYLDALASAHRQPTPGSAGPPEVAETAGSEMDGADRGGRSELESGRRPALMERSADIRAMRAARLELLGQQLKASIRRQVQRGELRFESFATDLDLTPGQQDQAKAILQPLAIAGLAGRQPDPEVAGQALAELFSMLTPEQRRKALALRRGARPTEAGALQR